MGISEGKGLPLAILLASASPGETTLVEATLEARFIEDFPARLMGDKAYDSDPLDARLLTRYGIDLIAPHRSNRTRPATQDGRALRRRKRRWKIERLFAWLYNFRRLIVRWERKPENFLAFLQLGCALILLRRL
jgi:transposase